MMWSEARAQKAPTLEEIARDKQTREHIAWLAEVREWLVANPKVGTLMREGALVFYTYYGSEYTEIPAFTEVV